MNNLPEILKKAINTPRRWRNQVANLFHLSGGKFFKKNISLLFSWQRGKSNQYKTQTDKNHYNINQYNWLYHSYLFNFRLIVQNNNIDNTPNATASELNLSSVAGNTTEANATTPISAAISDNLSSCFLESLGIENNIFYNNIIS